MFEYLNQQGKVSLNVHVHVHVHMHVLVHAPLPTLAHHKTFTIFQSRSSFEKLTDDKFPLHIRPVLSCKLARCANLEVPLTLVAA